MGRSPNFVLFTHQQNKNTSANVVLAVKNLLHFYRQLLWFSKLLQNIIKHTFIYLCMSIYYNLVLVYFINYRSTKFSYIRYFCPLNAPNFLICTLETCTKYSINKSLRISIIHNTCYIGTEVATNNFEFYSSTYMNID